MKKLEALLANNHPVVIMAGILAVAFMVGGAFELLKAVVS
jgi:hypothetical protein